MSEHETLLNRPQNEGYGTEQPSTSGTSTHANSSPVLISRGNKHSQHIAAFIANLGIFSLGTIFGWTAPAIPKIEMGDFGFTVTPVQIGWIASLISLGAAMTLIPIGFFVDKYGRKPTMLGLVIPFVFGWALIIWADNVGTLYTGRFITGIAGGGFCVATPIYTAEIASTNIRGQLGTLFQVMVLLGIVYAYIVGAIFSLTGLSAACAIVPIVFGILFLSQPESPFYYVQCQELNSARRVLADLRPSGYDIEAEIEEISKCVRERKENPVSFWNGLNSKAAKRSVLISFGLMIFQQFSAIRAITVYVNKVFFFANLSMTSDIAAIILGLAQIASTLFGATLMDKTGRRSLLLISEISVAVTLFFLGLSFNLKRDFYSGGVDSLGVTVVLILIVYVFAYSLGMGPVPWIINGEIFPNEIKYSAGGIACTINLFCSFIVTRYFINLMFTGLDVTFWIYSGIAFVGTLFIFFFVPETKGKSFNEIQNELENEPAIIS